MAAFTDHLNEKPEPLNHLLHQTLSDEAHQLNADYIHNQQYINCSNSVNVSFPLSINNQHRINCSSHRNKPHLTTETPHPLTDIWSISLNYENNSKSLFDIHNDNDCDNPLIITLPHHPINDTPSFSHSKCALFNENIRVWNSTSCLVLSQNINETQCGCYNITQYINSNITNPSDHTLSFMVYTDPMDIQSLNAASNIAIIFVSIIWFFGCCLYCFAPLRDDVPLISKNVIIPSDFRYRMFTHTKEGRINDILRHRRDLNACKRYYSLLCVYFDNTHICCSLWRRNMGTNIYQCDRILLFIFHILCIAFLSLYILISLIDYQVQNSLLQNEFIWMLITAFITFIIIELFITCIGSSTPNRLQPETIELLVETESKRVKAMKEAAKHTTKRVSNPEKIYDAQYFDKKYVSAEKEIEKIIHNDSESRRLLQIDVAKWDIHCVGVWVHSLGLGRYESEFKHHQIEGKKLLRLQSDNINHIITERKDIEFFNTRLNKLKLRWKYRFIQLRKRRAKAQRKAKEHLKIQLTVNEPVKIITPQHKPKKSFLGGLTRMFTKRDDPEDVPQFADNQTSSNSIRNTFRQLALLFGKGTGPKDSNPVPQETPADVDDLGLKLRYNSQNIIYPLTPNRFQIEKTNRFQNLRNAITVRWADIDVFDEKDDVKDNINKSISLRPQTSASNNKTKQIENNYTEDVIAMNSYMAALKETEETVDILIGEALSPHNVELQKVINTAPTQRQQRLSVDEDVITRIMEDDSESNDIQWEQDMDDGMVILDNGDEIIEVSIDLDDYSDEKIQTHVEPTIPSMNAPMYSNNQHNSINRNSNNTYNINDNTHGNNYRNRGFTQPLSYNQQLNMNGDQQQYNVYPVSPNNNKPLPLPPRNKPLPPHIPLNVPPPPPPLHRPLPTKKHTRQRSYTDGTIDYNPKPLPPHPTLNPHTRPLPVNTPHTRQQRSYTDRSNPLHTAHPTTKPQSAKGNQPSFFKGKQSPIAKRNKPLPFFNAASGPQISPIHKQKPHPLINAGAIPRQNKPLPLINASTGPLITPIQKQNKPLPFINAAQHKPLPLLNASTGPSISPIQNRTQFYTQPTVKQQQEEHKTVPFETLPLDMSSMKKAQPINYRSLGSSTTSITLTDTQTSSNPPTVDNHPFIPQNSYNVDGHFAPPAPFIASSKMNLNEDEGIPDIPTTPEQQINILSPEQHKPLPYLHLHQPMIPPAMILEPIDSKTETFIGDDRKEMQRPPDINTINIMRNRQPTQGTDIDFGDASPSRSHQSDLHMIGTVHDAVTVTMTHDDDSDDDETKYTHGQSIMIEDDRKQQESEIHLDIQPSSPGKTTIPSRQTTQNTYSTHMNPPMMMVQISASQTVNTMIYKPYNSMEAQTPTIVTPMSHESQESREDSDAGTRFTKKISENSNTTFKTTDKSKFAFYPNLGEAELVDEDEDDHVLNVPIMNGLGISIEVHPPKSEAPIPKIDDFKSYSPLALPPIPNSNKLVQDSPISTVDGTPPSSKFPSHDPQHSITSMSNSIYNKLDLKDEPKKGKVDLGELNEDASIDDIPDMLQIPSNPLHNRVDSNVSFSNSAVSQHNEFNEGDFVDLILRDVNNLVVIGLIVSYNNVSKLADIRILPSKAHNRGNDIERFVECSDLRYKGFRINDLAVLRYQNIDKYPSGFELDFALLIEDNLFAFDVVKEWENGINKPSALELFDGLKVRLKEVNPSGMIIVTILPSMRAQQYLLQQTSIKVDIIHIMSLREYHQKRESMLETAPPETIDKQETSSLKDGEIRTGSDLLIKTTTAHAFAHFDDIEHQSFGDNAQPLNTLDQDLANQLNKNPALARAIGTPIKTAHHGIFSGSIVSSIGAAMHFSEGSLADNVEDTNHSVQYTPSVDNLFEHARAVKTAAFNLYGNAFAADKDVIRSDFYERRRIMTLHYNINTFCRIINRLSISLLCIFFTLFIVFKMENIMNQTTDNTVNNNNLLIKKQMQCNGKYLVQNPFLIDDNIFFDSSIFVFEGIDYMQMYWLIFTITSILMYNFVVFPLYFSFASLCLMLKQKIFKIYRINLCLIPFIFCYYSNGLRLKQIESASSSLCCKCCVKTQNERFSVDDYGIGNTDLLYKLFCCYFRCLNCCHYGLRQEPNAPHLLAFFDPIKTFHD